MRQTDFEAFLATVTERQVVYVVAEMISEGDPAHAVGLLQEYTKNVAELTREAVDSTYQSDSMDN